MLSLNFPFTLGQFTIAFSLLLILVQLAILRRDFKAEHVLQIPISILFIIMQKFYVEGVTGGAVKG